MRTEKQQAAIEVFCRNLAESLSDAGIGMKDVFEIKQVDIPWNQERVKDIFWRQIQQAMLGKRSTTNLEKSEVDQVYEVINKLVSENWGIHVPFPSKDNV